MDTGLQTNDQSQPWPGLTKTVYRFSLGLVAGLFTAFSVHATSLNNELPDDLTDMSLEALMNIEVTSVSKKPQKQSEAAAAIFVITNDDLRRWGVTNVPEALRRVPGIDVARIDANKWAITSRGFNSRFANKLLVLIDGRSVYTPLFAGVYWDSQDVVLEDVERIEVIRGPGGTLWGANAVNGVINIITKNAADTQGNMVSVTAGNEVKGIGSVRHGGKFRNGADYRIYAKYNSYDEGYNAAGAHDDWRSGQIGFRTDWVKTDRDDITLQGDYYRGKAGQLVNIPTGPAGPPPTTIVPTVSDTDTNGGNLLFRWSHKLENTSNFALQLYYDHVGLDGEVLFEDRDTFDADFQHHFKWQEKHDIVWGLHYRHTSDDTDNNATFSLDPSSRRVNLYSTFFQDEFSLRDNLRLTAGIKLEHNDFSGFEYQPNVRLAWAVYEKQTWWGSVSRAVRTPARGEHDFTMRLVPPPASDPGIPVVAAGNSDYDSEDLIAYELGYRLNYNNLWSVDVAAFYNDYDKLRTLDPAFDPGPPPSVQFPFDNNMTGKTYGMELAGQWQVRKGWRLNASYSWLDTQLRLINGSTDAFSKGAEDASPVNKAAVWSALDFGNNLQFDAALRYVGNVTVTGVKIDSYVEADLRLGWEAKPGLELSLIGQNLLNSRHAEYLPDFINTQSTEVERSIYGRVTWSF
ncbi:MAG: TonB-dependent receptor [Gammaproteobacteria bacterium]|nr:MAG: TonB-dependent receptor [Gammaproteobacteria bacterium]